MSKDFWKKWCRLVYYSFFFIVMLIYIWLIHIPITYTLVFIVSTMGLWFNGEFKYTFRNILYELQIDLKHIYSVSSLKEAWGVAMERVND